MARLSKGRSLDLLVKVGVVVVTALAPVDRASAEPAPAPNAPVEAGVTADSSPAPSAQGSASASGELSPDEEARRKAALASFYEGSALFREQKYNAAAAAFLQSFEIVASIESLWAAANSYRLAGEVVVPRPRAAAAQADPPEPGDQHQRRQAPRAREQRAALPEDPDQLPRGLGRARACARLRPRPRPAPGPASSAAAPR